MKKAMIEQQVLGMVSTNVWFLKNNETGELLIIDPAAQTDRIEQKVQMMGGTPVAVLLTHGHFDHYAREQLTGRYVTDENWTFYLPPQTAAPERERLQKSLQGAKGNPPRRAPEIADAVPFVPMDIMGYRVTPLPARHAPSIGSLIYLIEKDGTAVLWDHDSGLMLPETIEYLRGLDVHLDFVSLDCNLARGQNISPYHMDILQANETAQLLHQMGRADERTRFFISHFSHLLDRTHAELCEEAKEFGFEVAYDGMEIDI